MGGHTQALDFYRNLVTLYMERHDYETAIYWADKVVSLSMDGQQDIYQLAQAFYYGGQYMRAVNLVQRHGFERSNLHFRCLTARCLLAAKDFSKALDVLDLDNKSLNPGDKIRKSRWEPPDVENLMMGQLCLIRGKVYEAIMNRIIAVHNYKEALRYDVYCYEAYQLLTQHNMLSRMEELDLFEKLSLETQCKNNDTELIRFLYSLNVKSYAEPGTEPSHIEFPLLRKNLDVMTSDAERLFYDCDYLQTKKLCSQILAEDPLHERCLPIYIGSLVELKDPGELFKVAHKLIQQLPNTPLGWYSVGSYYFLIGKHDSARRNLNKALCLDAVFGPAWLTFGHSFATEGEHDQAMAAYFKATQLMKGCHLPLLHVGMECGLSNNSLLAMRFLEEAIALAPKDPTVRHEMGVIKFHEKKYPEALELFKQTLDIVEKPRNKLYLKKWEPLYNNLGHVCRKLKRYNEALFYHRKALLLLPANASTHSAIGLLHAVTGKLDLAVESFHKALSLKRDDAFSNTMLRYVVEKMVEEGKDDDLLISDEDKEDDAETEDSSLWN